MLENTNIAVSLTAINMWAAWYVNDPIKIVIEAEFYTLSSCKWLADGSHFVQCGTNYSAVFLQMYFSITGSENLTAVIMKCTIFFFLSYFLRIYTPIIVVGLKHFSSPELFRRLLFTPAWNNVLRPAVIPKAFLFTICTRCGLNQPPGGLSKLECLISPVKPTPLTLLVHL